MTKIDVEKGLRDPNTLYDMSFAMSQAPTELHEWKRLATWIKSYLIKKYGEDNFRVKYVNAILNDTDWAVKTINRDGLRFLMHSEILGDTIDKGKHSSWLYSVKRRIEVDE